MREQFRITGEMRSLKSLQAALAYAHAGLKVVGVWGVKNGKCQCGSGSCKAGKHPITNFFPRGFKDATTDDALIRKVWKRYPNANIGIVVDQDLLIMDVDSEEGRDWVAVQGLPSTATVRTARGEHLYFLASKNVLTNLPRVKGVDFRHSGNGYVIAAPSTHVSGVRYEWVKGANGLSVLRAPLAGAKIHTVDFSGVSDLVREGGRDNRLTSIAGGLRAMGLGSTAIQEGLLAINETICEPPLPEADIARISFSVGRYPTTAEKAFGLIADVKEEPINWLYPPYIPRGAVTILDGDPGVGKSNFCLAMAAAISTGTAVPWSRESARGNVLVLSAEDDPARVLKPRLRAFGASIRRIRYQREAFTLDERGITLLRNEMERHRPVLVIIDPIVAYMAGGDDLNKATDMTRFMSQIDLLAREFDCSILIVRHLKKSTDQMAMYRGIGSIAVTARVRSGLLLGRHPEGGNRRAVAHIKSNYSKEGPTILFSLVKRPESSWPIVSWDGTSEWITADELIAQSIGQVGRPPKETENAMFFLKAFLADGARDKREVVAAAEKAKITKMTLRRAAQELRIHMKRKGRSSLWSLPKR